MEIAEVVAIVKTITLNAGVAAEHVRHTCTKAIGVLVTVDRVVVLAAVFGHTVIAAVARDRVAVVTLLVAGRVAVAAN